ncbi:MAG TPA: hypothetical protein DFI01_10870 [Bacteroidales bacterium]|nr:hypothetical protein [Bacteroidales bacterium]
MIWLRPKISKQFDITIWINRLLLFKIFLKSLFVDTNIVPDLLAHRMPYYTGVAKLFSLADRKERKLFVI